MRLSTILPAQWLLGNQTINESLVVALNSVQIFHHQKPAFAYDWATDQISLSHSRIKVTREPHRTSFSSFCFGLDTSWSENCVSQRVEAHPIHQLVETSNSCSMKVCYLHLDWPQYSIYACDIYCYIGLSRPRCSHFLSCVLLLLLVWMPAKR